MKLHYKILWIDDNIDSFVDAGINTEFENYLESLGFDPIISLFETGDKALEKLSEDKKYDLILSDYNIAGGEQGDSLIRRIREGDVFTEVLFYSAQPNFDDVAQKLYQDRVSFLSLAGDDGFRYFKEKTYWLINLTISKIQELNNIRGLVMAETSELDNTIEGILIELMTKDNEIAKKLRTYAIKKIEENNTQRVQSVSTINDLSNTDLIKNRLLFDANKKSRTLNEYLKITGLTSQSDTLKNFHSNYEKDVLLVRNDLAHAKSEVIDGVECLIVTRKGEEHPTKIDQERCIQIRRDLHKYTSILKEIRDSLIAIEGEQ